MKEGNFRSKIKAFFSNRRNVVVIITIVSFLILVLITLFFWLVYTKDEPSFVPEETKGKIRKGIEENIGDNVKRVSPDLGQGIIDASYDNQNKGTASNEQGSTKQLNTAPDDETVGWMEYRDKTGFVLKYPSNWILDTGLVPAIIPDKSSETGLFIYANQSDIDPEAWWNNEKSKYGANFNVDTMKINNYSVVRAEENGGLGEIHYIFKSGSYIVDATLIGQKEVGSQIIQTLN